MANVTGGYAHSCIKLQELCIKYNINVEFCYIFNESLIQRGRNDIVYRFLKSKHTHLIFIDADLAFNPEDVLKLVSLNREVIGGTYPRKRINWNNIKHAIKINPMITPEELEIFAADFIFKVKDGIESFTMDEPVEVDNLPTGFMCIRKDVIHKMIEAYPNIEHFEYNTESGIPESRYAVFECRYQ